jgi:uncharacterized SAM-binding protein YcdF (DUF218 family)
MDMRQLISGMLTFLLSPAVWVILLILLSCAGKNARKQKRWRFLALGIFLLFSNQWLLDGYAGYWQPGPRDVSADSMYSCGILLGGFGSPDARNNGGYFNSSADRLIQAVKLYHARKIRYILVSGGNGKQAAKDFNEGAWARNELEAMGVPANAVLFEDRSSNTADNAVNSKKILEEANCKPPYLLITSAAHMPRASLLFHYAGIKTVAFPCNYIAGKGKFRFLGIIPDPGVLHDWNTFIKETVSYWLYRLKGK